MIYLLAIVLPPVAVLLCGKPITAILNVFLCLLFWVPGVIHAIIVVNGHKADKRHKQMVKTVEKQTVATVAAIERQGSKHD